MSGLFSRLAQQHLNQRMSSIMPAQSPVFPMEINERNADVSDVDKEQILPHQQVEPSAQIKNSDPVMNDQSDNSVSNSHARNNPDVAKPKINFSVTPLLTPVINSTTKVSTVHEVETPLSSVSLLTPEVEPSIQPQLPENGDSLQMPFVSDNDKQTLFSKGDDTNLWPRKKSITKQKFDIHNQAPPSSISNRKEQLPQKFSQHVHDENQTTINVSIGQIEIKATQAEQFEKKPATRSNRTVSNALEEYHQKRVRGEQ